MPVNPMTALPEGEKRTKTSAGALGLIPVLALHLAFSPALAHGRLAAQGQQRQPLGSLSTIGEVYVNDARAPAESTVFSGDTLRTSEAGSATFVMSGKGSFKIAPQSQLVFAGDPGYVAELKSGTVVMSSFGGATDVILRIGNFVVVQVLQGEQSAAKIAREADGSFLISCLDGSVGVIRLQGSSGQLLLVGQSATISLQGDLVALKEPAAPSPASTTTATVKKKSHTGWIILGLVGGGAAGGAAAALGHHGGQSSISPSSP